MLERAASVASMGLCGSVAVMFLAPVAWGQVLAYESFRPLDGADFSPLIGTATESFGWSGGWEISNTGESDRFRLSRRDGLGTAPGPGLLQTNYRIMHGDRTDATVGRRVDLSAPQYDSFRQNGGNTFGKAGSTVWVGMTLGSAEAWTDITAVNWDGRSELVLHNSADVTSVSGGGLKLSVGKDLGLNVSVGNSSPTFAGYQGWPTFVAIKLQYGTESTRISVYNTSLVADEFTLQTPAYETLIRKGDERAPSGIVSWNAISWAPAVGGIVRPDFGRDVQGMVGDLRIGGSYADVSPSQLSQRWPTWKGSSGGSWEEAGNWTGEGAPVGPRDVVVLGEAASPQVIVTHTDLKTQGVRFNSLSPYRIEGEGRFAVTSGLAASALNYDGGRLFDVWKGRHEIAVPVTGDYMQTAVRVLADTFLTVKAIDGGHLKVVGDGEFEVKEGTRVQTLKLMDNVKVTLRSNKEEVPALTSSYLGSVEVDQGAELRLAHSGCLQHIVVAGEVGYLQVAGLVRLESPQAGSKPVMLRINYGFQVEMWADVQGRIDLGVNMLGAFGSESYISELLHSGRNGGSWDGPGISSSSAVEPGLALGHVNVSQVPEIGSLGVEQLVALTYYGDTDLNGVVDEVDRARLEVGLASDGALSGWFNGDFDYDGVVDFRDAALFEFGWARQDVVLGLGAVVPEPLNPLWFGVVSIWAMSRRRRDAVMDF